MNIIEKQDEFENFEQVENIDELEHRSYICDIYDSFTRIVGAHGASTKFLLCLFIKSLTNDAIDYANQDIQTMSKFFTLLGEYKDNKVSITTLKEVFAVLEKSLGLHNGSLSYSLPLYSFYCDSEENQKKINSLLDKIKDDRSDLFSRKIRLRMLMDYMFKKDKGNSQYSSSYLLCRIARSILKIKREDSVLNVFLGTSSLYLFINECKEYCGYENDIYIYPISIMVLLMCGLRSGFNSIEKAPWPNNDLQCTDFYFPDEDRKYDKIFCDGPINTKIDDGMCIDDSDLKEYSSNSDFINLKECYELLNEKGIALVTVSNKALVSYQSAFKFLRNKLTKEGLEAVISLPGGIINGTALPTSLVVLKKGYKGDVVFIDASKSSFMDSRGHYNHQVIRDLILSYRSKKEIEFFSMVVSREMLQSTDACLWYLEKEVTKEKRTHRDLSNIETDINNVLKMIIENNK